MIKAILAPWASAKRILKNIHDLIFLETGKQLRERRMGGRGVCKSSSIQYFQPQDGILKFNVDVPGPMGIEGALAIKE